MISGEAFVERLRRMRVTHVIWLPDSTLGGLETALSNAEGLMLIRVCRESEAWGIAAGLHLGGKRPLVMMQCTGLFDSGDALRNFLFDYHIPLFAVIGHRNRLNPQATDSARDYTERILTAWGLSPLVIEGPDGWYNFENHWEFCHTHMIPGIALLPEGAM